MRTSFYSVEYQNRIKSEIKTIKFFAQQHFGAQDLTNAHIQNFFKTVTEKNKAIAGIMFFENENNISFSSKKSLFNEEQDFEKFKNLYNQKVLSVEKIETKSFNGKNYQYFIIKDNSFEILIIYSYKFPGIIIIKLIFEYIALLACLAVFILLIYNGKTLFILLKNRNLTPLKKSDDFHKPIEEVKKNIKPANEKTAQKKPEIRDISINTKEIKVNSLESFAFEFFRKLCTNFNLTHVSLNIYNSEKNITVKTYETKGETFAKLSKENNTKEMKVLLNELKQGAYIFKNQSRSIYFPLIYSKNFLGFLEMNKNEAFTGSECEKLSVELKILSAKINETAGKK